MIGMVTSDPPDRLRPQSPPPGLRGEQVAVWSCSSDPIPDPAEAVSVGEFYVVGTPRRKGSGTQTRGPTGFPTEVVPCSTTGAALHRRGLRLWRTST